MFQELLTPAYVIGGIGIIFGVGLSFAAKKFAVKIDKRIELVKNELPGSNCGACGETGCEPFAEAVVDGRVKVSGCIIGGEDVAKKVGDILGVAPEPTESTVAKVLCNGSMSRSKFKFEYNGIEDCASASTLFGGPLSCSYGCVGMGSCKKVCPFDAIEIEDGLARIIFAKCTGCGNCVDACPKSIIKLLPLTKHYKVGCSSLDKGAIVRKNCSVGCIGCRKCSKICKFNAIEFEGTLAKITPDKCTNCGECFTVCPTKAITLSVCRDNVKQI